MNGHESASRHPRRIGSYLDKSPSGSCWDRIRYPGKILSTPAEIDSRADPRIERLSGTTILDRPTLYSGAVVALQKIGMFFCVLLNPVDERITGVQLTLLEVICSLFRKGLRLVSGKDPAVQSVTEEQGIVWL